METSFALVDMEEEAKRVKRREEGRIHKLAIPSEGNPHAARGEANGRLCRRLDDEAVWQERWGLSRKRIAGEGVLENTSSSIVQGAVPTRKRQRHVLEQLRREKSGLNLFEMATQRHAGLLLLQRRSGGGMPQRLHDEKRKESRVVRKEKGKHHIRDGQHERFLHEGSAQLTELHKGVA